jgi:beta-xylosidase
MPTDTLQMFFDDDDRVYLSVSRFSVSSRQLPGSKLITYASEIDLKTGSSIGPVVALRTSRERLGVAEGPHIYKYGGWYYLVTAEGGTGPGHRVWITRSQNPLGPYEEAPEGVNPLVFNGEDPAVQRTGHADLVQGPDGKWWAVLLGVRTQATGLAHLGRETFLAPVEWEEGGWPKINQGRPIGLSLPGYLPKAIEKPKVWRDDFDKGM